MDSSTQDSLQDKENQQTALVSLFDQKAVYRYLIMSNISSMEGAEDAWIGQRPVPHQNLGSIHRQLTVVLVTLLMGFPSKRFHI